MRRISVSSSRSDCLVVRVGRDFGRLAAGGVPFIAVWVALLLSRSDTPPFSVALGFAFFVLPPWGVMLFRFARATERTLVRAQGRLLLDGEPLDMARVELRVVKMPITRRPRGYALSLWVMTASGPEDVPIGHSRTLLEASSLSGQLEEFVQRANIKQHRHV
jgi:hypothetical protein